MSYIAHIQDNKKIGIVGATGLIGKELTRILCEMVTETDSNCLQVIIVLEN